MLCLGFKPDAAGLKVQTDPLSYGGHPHVLVLNLHRIYFCSNLTMLFDRYLSNLFVCFGNIFPLFGHLLLSMIVRAVKCQSVFPFDPATCFVF